MTNTELIQKIRNEIERLEKENCINSGEHFCMRRALCLGRLNKIISESQQEQMKSEKPMQEGLEKEIEAQLSIFPYTKVSPELPESRLNVIRKVLYMFARHFAEWGAEHLKK